MKKFFMIIAASMFFVTFAQATERCTYELKNGRGRTLDVFRSWGYDQYEACREARRDCRRVKRSGHYRARYLTCEKALPRWRQVTRSCSADLIGRRGRVRRSFYASVTGRRGTGLKQEACRKAVRKCRRFKRANGRYRAECVVNRYNRRRDNDRGGWRLGVDIRL